MVSVCLANIIKDYGINMNNYQKHALVEFKAAGWLDENDKFKDEMQALICNQVLRLLDIFGGQGHTGSTAPYTINLFKTLAMFEPVSPLTGLDWEWVDVSDRSPENKPLWQNVRCGRIFKDENHAYDIEGIVWYNWSTDEKTGEKFKSHFTNRESRVPVTFPYLPKTEVKEWIENDESGTLAVS